MKQDFDVRAGDVSSMELYYSGSNQENRCIGHIRGDFGKNGDEYWAAFCEHEGSNAAGEGYKEELNALVKALRKNLLKNRKSMRKYIQRHPPLILEAGSIMSYGYQVTTEKYGYYIRCTPCPGVYDFYIYMYVRGCDSCGSSTAKN